MIKKINPRIDKLLVNLGYGSRKEVRALIKAKNITYNGDIVNDFSIRVNPQKILLNGRGLDCYEGIYVLFNKPIGYVCSHNENNSIYSLIPDRWLLRIPKVSCVGRLDKDCSGLMILTDDVNFLHNIISPSRKVEKTYSVEIEYKLSKQDISLLESGKIQLKGEKKVCQPLKVKVIDDNNIEIRIFEGKYHQIKRMIGFIGNKVINLTRTHIDNLSIENLKLGEWRKLTQNEIKKYL